MDGPEFDTPEEEPRDPRVCEACGSHDVAERPRWMLFIVVAALLISIARVTGTTELAWFGIPAALLFVVMAGGWRCRECGEAWNG